MKEIEIAAKALDALARCSELLGNVAIKIRELSGVLAISHRLEFRDYRTGPLMEAFVDAELKDGTARTIWLEMKWSSDAWRIDSALLALDDKGRQETIREFPGEEVLSLQEFESKMTSVIERLGRSMQEIGEVRGVPR